MDEHLLDLMQASIPTQLQVGYAMNHVEAAMGLVKYTTPGNATQEPPVWALSDVYMSRCEGKFMPPAGAIDATAKRFSKSLGDFAQHIRAKQLQIGVSNGPATLASAYDKFLNGGAQCPDGSQGKPSGGNAPPSGELRAASANGTADGPLGLVNLKGGAKGDPRLIKLLTSTQDDPLAVPDPSATTDFSKGIISPSPQGQATSPKPLAW